MQGQAEDSQSFHSGTASSEAVTGPAIESAGTECPGLERPAAGDCVATRGQRDLGSPWGQVPRRYLGSMPDVVALQLVVAAPWQEVE